MAHIFLYFSNSTNFPLTRTKHTYYKTFHPGSLQLHCLSFSRNLTGEKNMTPGIWACHSFWVWIFFPQWWGSVTYSKHVSLGPSFTRTVRATPMEGKRNRVVRRNRWNPMQSSQQPHLAHGNSSELIQVGESSRTIICPHWESLDTDHPWDKAWHWVRQFSSADATVRRTESTIF